eukprot:CAMPEP_0115140052 /NCGR_PEP_ID=MMETSP0227-20121206/58682_1 /TAXON_ID=89957 /ORGANISM="Polarella glacialis, Strain CCMP 1383" /LENGTH=201 /DNA_ID=CAMNT_0002548089 /DNA_START=42 /DNA_END=643 /DNA_ORIENTATION=+
MRTDVMAMATAASSFDFCKPLAGTVTFGRTHLCVFIPITQRTPKDFGLALAALQTWASERLQRESGAHVRFISVQSTNGTALEPHTMYVPGDVDTDYDHLPVRILKMWEYLGRHRSEECDWYLKADPDTYVNLRALSDRLSCFDAEEQHYLGVVHAAGAAERFLGSGYLVSRGLVSFIGRLAGPCLEDVMAATDGDAMEDV